MRKDKVIAIKLRKSGKSYSQINRLLGVPKSTLSYWLKDLVISKIAQGKINKRAYEKSIKSLIKRNKNQTFLARERAEKIKKEAKQEFLKFFKDPLFIAGVSLYWAEGYKKGAHGSKWKSVDFANSDPEMIKIMMKFFRKFCEVEENRFRIQLISHPNINLNKAIEFWSIKTNISRKQFIKTSSKISIYSKGKRDKKTLTNGTVHIRISDVKLFFRIIGWIEGLKDFLKNK
jgi:predicted transcriptional regulator